MAAAEEDVSRGVKEEVSVKEEVKVEQVREPAIFEYSTGLCDCEENCQDPFVCAVGCCCPCFLFGKNAEYAGVPGGYWASCLAPFVPIVGHFFFCYSSMTAHNRIAIQNDKDPNWIKNILCHIPPGTLCLPCYTCQLRRQQVLQGGDNGFGPNARSKNLGLKAPQR